MPGFVFRCPITRLNVQGWVADDPTQRDEDCFDAVTCTACARMHLVNPRTGKVLGADDDEWKAGGFSGRERRTGAGASGRDFD